MNYDFLRNEPVNLARYLPAFLYKSPTFKALQDALEKEHETLRLDIDGIGQQMYVDSANSDGLALWEKMLAIETDTSLDLTTRRAAILAKLGKTPSVTVAFLTAMINRFVSVPATQIVENPSEYTVDIYLPDTGTHDFSKIDESVSIYMPAHLGHTYHFKTRVEENFFVGSIARLIGDTAGCGMLLHDEVLQTTPIWSVDTPVFAISDDDTVHPTELGLKINPVFNANTTTISPSPDAPVGATDGIFYVADDGMIRLKEKEAT